LTLSIEVILNALFVLLIDRSHAFRRYVGEITHDYSDKSRSQLALESVSEGELKRDRKINPATK
jgi:hypothetical protein